MGLFAQKKVDGHKSNRLIQSRLLCKACSTKQTNYIKYGASSESATLEHRQKIRNARITKGLFIQDSNELDMLHGSKRITYICKVCGNLVNVNFRMDKKDKLKRLLCKACACRDTSISNYNVSWPSKLESSKINQVSTKISKYGSVYARHRYKFGSNFFDSSWELAFFIYQKINNRNIIREPVKLEYKCRDETHFYFPDFMVNNKLYEVKGPQFWNKDGTMCNPFNHDLDDFAEAKHQCGIANNVIFITKSDIDIIKNELFNMFGNDILERFKI